MHLSQLCSRHHKGSFRLLLGLGVLSIAFLGLFEVLLAFALTELVNRLTPC